MAMARNMSEADVRDFMGTGSRTGKLSTVRSNGTPHVAPVWFAFDDINGDLVFVTHENSLKARNLRRQPAVSILVDMEEMPFAWARLDGVATTQRYEQDPAVMLEWAHATCERYVGSDAADLFASRNAVAGELLVRVRPTRLVGQFGVAD